MVKDYRFPIVLDEFNFSGLFENLVQSCFLLNYISKQIRLKMLISLYFVRPKRPSGNCYVSCFLTDKTALDELA